MHLNLNFVVGSDSHGLFIDGEIQDLVVTIIRDLTSSKTIIEDFLKGPIQRIAEVSVIIDLRIVDFYPVASSRWWSLTKDSLHVVARTSESSETTEWNEVDSERGGEGGAFAIGQDNISEFVISSDFTRSLGLNVLDWRDGIVSAADLTAAEGTLEDLLDTPSEGITNITSLPLALRNVGPSLGGFKDLLKVGGADDGENTAEDNEKFHGK